MSYADDVRKYCVFAYVNPARRNSEKFIKIRSGDVHRALNYRNRYPLVCSAIGSNLFEDLAQVTRVSIEGPLNGSNTVFTFQLI